VTFPVVPSVALDVSEGSEDVCTKIKMMYAEKDVLKTVANKKKEAEEKQKKLVVKRNEKKRKYDEISELMSQPSGGHQFHQYQPGQTSQYEKGAF
jgi:hypothetical protein